MKRFIMMWMVFVITASVFLSACGGGGGGSPQPQTKTTGTVKVVGASNQNQ